MSDHPIIFRADGVRATLDKRKTQARRVVTPQPTVEIDHWEHLAGAYNGWVGCNKKTYPDDNVIWPVGYNRFDSIKCPYGKVGDRLWVQEGWRCTGGGDLRNIIYRADGDSAMSYCGIDDGRTGILHVPEPHWPEWDRLVYETSRSCNWRSPSHMPKWAARIWLEITGTRIERVQDISEEDAIAEGIELVERRKHRSDDSYRVYLANTSHLRKPCDGPGYYYRTCGPTTCAQMLWDSLHASPKPVMKNGRIAHYVSYPWEDIQEVREHRGLKHFVYGNPWNWVIEFKLLTENRT